MKSSSSIGADETEKLQQGIRPLLIISGISSLIILFFLLQQANEDPYLKKTLALHGSVESGNTLFRMNCVGCHGIAAQGLVGPSLNTVTSELDDKKIIGQVIKGLTPPMPSFEIEPQSMADLIAYLHSLESWLKQTLLKTF